MQTRQVKIFSGTASEVEKQINDWFAKDGEGGGPIQMTQSHNGDGGVIISIWHMKKGP